MENDGLMTPLQTMTMVMEMAMVENAKGRSLQSVVTPALPPKDSAAPISRSIQTDRKIGLVAIPRVSRMSIVSSK